MFIDCLFIFMFMFMFLIECLVCPNTGIMVQLLSVASFVQYIRINGTGNENLNMPVSFARMIVYRVGWTCADEMSPFL